MSSNSPASPVIFEKRDLAGRPADQGPIGLVQLNRPEAAGAFNLPMMEGLYDVFHKVSVDPDLRLLIIKGTGKHFSAGADLEWMRQSAQLTAFENEEDARHLRRMFESLSQCPLPTFAMTHGAVYGGAVGLVACCDFVLAHSSSRFCLSEARVGLIPAVIYPYLLRRFFSPAQLKGRALTAEVMTSADACALGLVDLCFDDTESWAQALEVKMNQILTASPQAQKQVKKLHHQLLDNLSYEQEEEWTCRAIAEIRTSKEGQEGLQSFFNKKRPDWVQKVAEGCGMEILKST